MKYYVYIHRNLEGKTFYVGKGKRAEHDKRTPIWEQAATKGYIVEYIAEGLEEEQALLIEMSIIKALTPDLANVARTDQILTPAHYKAKSHKPSPSSFKKDTDEILKKIQRLKGKLVRNKLTEEEKFFYDSGKWMHTKVLTQDEIELRDVVTKKLKTLKSVNEKLILLNNKLL